MKEISQPYLLLIICVSLNNMALPMAYAGTKAKAQPVPTRTVRVTTGIEAEQGWEQGLVRANPNLGRWHWDPIYSYRQGYAQLPLQSARPDTAPGQKSRPNKSTFNYPLEKRSDDRPSHIPYSALEKRSDDRPSHIPYSPEAIKEVQARYSQPANFQAPVAAPMSEERVSANLSQHPQVEPSGEPTTATYGQLYSRRENLGTALKYNSQRTSVYGQLLKADEKTGYNGTKAIRKGQKGQKK